MLRTRSSGSVDAPLAESAPRSHHGASTRAWRCLVKVSSILATKGTTVETIGPDATVERAAQRMRASHLGALVVSTDGTHYQGLISERDIVYGFGKHGRTLFDMRVGDIMHKAGPRCSASDTVEEVM